MKEEIRLYDCYADVIDAGVLARREEADAEEREPKFYVSSFGTCHRKMVMQRAGIPGRPLTIDQMRNFEERGLLHDARVKQLAARPQRALVAADTGTPYAKAAAPTRLSDAFPEGFGCRADGIGHVACRCGHSPFTVTVHWGKMARLYKMPELRDKAEASRRYLQKHLLDVVEVKTAHANLINYSSTLPRPHNVLQVRAGAWAVRKLYGLTNIRPVLLYFAVGSGNRALEYVCGGGESDTYEDVEREITTLQQEWALYQDEGLLPPCKPLTTKTKREGSNRVVFRVVDWECNDLYCPYAHNGCNPLETINKTGDRLGYEESDGSTTFVEKWTSKVPGYSIIGAAQTIAMPRAPEPKPKYQPDAEEESDG